MAKEPICFNPEVLLDQAAEREKSVKDGRKKRRQERLNQSLEEHNLQKCKDA